MRECLRIAVVTLSLGLLLMAILPPALVVADDSTQGAGEEEEPQVDPPEIEISPESGPVGTKVYVTLTNFEPDETVEVYFSDITEPVKTWPSDGEGYVHTGFKVPEYPAGRFRVLANDGKNNLYVFFTVEPTITIGETSGRVGDEVTVEGTGFGDDEDVTIYMDGKEMGSSSTDSCGSFNASCVVPPCAQGRQTIKAEDDADNYDTVDFVVEHSLAIEPTEGTPGTELTVSGTGFTADTDVSISFGEEEIDVTHTGHDGTFQTAVAAPGGAAGAYQVKADDGRVREYASFELVSSASISAGGDSIGSSITVSGSGFLPRSEITIEYDHSAVAAAQSDGMGAFSVAFAAPRSKAGDHVVTVTDGANSSDLSYTVEGSPPATPVLLGPDDGTKAGGQIYFDWQDVQDPSGVMYSLDIAMDAEFTELVRSEPSLLASEYLLSEENALSRTGKDAPYYWRVRATDLAGNQSAWSTPRTFTVGFNIGIPRWAMYSLVAIGAFLVLCIVIWVLGALTGRRRPSAEPIDESELGMEDMY